MRIHVTWFLHTQDHLQQNHRTKRTSNRRHERPFPWSLSSTASAAPLAQPQSPASRRSHHHEPSCPSLPPTRDAAVSFPSPPPLSLSAMRAASAAPVLFGPIEGLMPVFYLINFINFSYKIL